MALLSITGGFMNQEETEARSQGEIMPVFFFGHGSPMNAIEENQFSKTWQSIGKSLPKPTAILCISAHWETRGTFITAMPKPPTIHDFGGFPKALFDVQYPAPGNPSLAKEIQKGFKYTQLGLDEDWGLDHGTWSVLKHVFPKADVPVLQLSLNHNQKPEYHYELAKELRALRKKGVLIVGSGNTIHNLRLVDWNKVHEPSYGFDWAIEANTKIKQWVQNGRHDELIKFKSQGKAFDLAIPTPEHYLPLLYTLGLQEEKDRIEIFNDKEVMGSLAMTSFRFG
ncbi:4,5-DOPA dioxygenase extradiol [Leptospira idonii]|uniref:4,5-DOPA dioxygenase extradiol n=2 Tax=Leptospira idonii TaxID=1193500 RepID=A0A4V3JXX1_9LEPT|nr:4,5-DOPA dioxygenase extradiol [Leptospira idonii]